MRDRKLNSAQRATAIALPEQLRRSWDEIPSIEAVRAIAEWLPEDYGARARDAWQLAAVLVWCSERTRGRPFCVLRQAPRGGGFDMGFMVQPN